MKKHDFESTSKKNAKEQTPEMAEREQEILMWMGDIRDDFILEAEDYKHYQSDKSVPGYFIVGGTLAAAAAICTAIFFQTGRNRIDHSNVPMQLPYQTEETKEIEWETEEETTEEETTQAETTEEETTQVETTQAETTEAALQETTNEAIGQFTISPLCIRQRLFVYLRISQHSYILSFLSPPFFLQSTTTIIRSEHVNIPSFHYIIFQIQSCA